MVMKDCNFYCCNEFKNSEVVSRTLYIKPDDPSYKEYDGTFTASGLYNNEQIFYCPFCGSKLR